MGLKINKNNPKYWDENDVFAIKSLKIKTIMGDILLLGWIITNNGNI